MRFRSHRLSRQSIAFLHDLIMAALSFLVALGLRLGVDSFSRIPTDAWLAMLLFTVVCGVVFWRVGLYRGIWRYASLNDLVAIVRAVTFAILVFLPVTFLLTRLNELPRASLVINWFVLIFLLGAPRLLYRVFKDRGFGHVLERDHHQRIPVLLIGVGDRAEVFIREMARDRDGPYEVLGIVDEKGTRIGRRIHSVPVLGHLNDLERVVELVGARGRLPQKLIVTKRLERDDLARILDVADSRGIAIARLRRLTEFRSGEERLELKPVAIEDLLGRTQTKLDRAAMRRFIEGRRVLITGAGGSIGAELTRQIAAFQPAQMTLLDSSEYALYTIGLELDETFADLPRSLFLGDVRDRARLDEVMAAHTPELVFHAAALKHVPMVEANVIEGVLTNTLGTRNTAEACRKAGVAAMVLISTDKAINPSSVMGASKRLAESYCQALDIAGRRHGGTTGTRFITVRFGNVLGSTGSVVPLFHRQLAAGGPLTVTHPEMTRYFMTVREAVELVLQASALGAESQRTEAGKIYVLDMGEPVKIIDLAQQMIRLAGLRPYKDIEIAITGPRPGEKLREEVFHEAEPLLPTSHPGLRLASPRTVNLELLSRSFDDLTAMTTQHREADLLAMLHRLVPEYRAGEDPGKTAAVVS
jgi:O-antigen biosynthesis protein WbqV